MADWKGKLGVFFHEVEKVKQEKSGADVARFVVEVAIPAFEEIKTEMEKHGRTVTIRNQVGSATLSVHHNTEEELTYRIQCRIFPAHIVPYVDLRFRQRKGLRLIRVEATIREGRSEYRLADITKEEIVEHFVENYTRRVQVA
ncbi:MAG: hypothetical protein QME60_06330 [Verrucomicrobiota bacterium]|nr:hypothetical protein [Verrucomicrobiota bacterium]